MRILRSVAEVRSLSAEWRSRNLKVALVPTMGYLHDGHLSLVDQAKAHADRVIVSIFVNPTQFGANEDLDRYPRDFAHDEQLCRAASVDAVFYPEPASMYAADHSTWVYEESLSQTLCGASRPGHFRGVATVVLKLFNICTCHLAVFGRKDAQQALLIQRMVRDLNVPVEIILAPLLREADGLAMSSRNKFLSSTEHQQALNIYKGLQEAEKKFQQGLRNVAELAEPLRQRIVNSGGKVDYVEIMAQSTLRQLTVIDQPALLAVAAFFGNTRLIDNLFLEG